MSIDKSAQKRSLTNRISPAKTFGKWRTKLRSPVYAKALAFVEKSDDLIRDSVLRQKGFLKEMKKAKSNYSGSLFLKNLNSFKKDQLIINKIVEYIGNKFNDIKGDYESIDQAINHEILKTPKRKNIDYDLDEGRDNDTERAFRTLSGKIDNFVKSAFWGDSYWKNNIKSGKDYVEAFDIIYSKFANVFENNIELLKTLDNLRTVGDPTEYYAEAKRFEIADAIIKNPKIRPSLDKLRAVFKSQEVKENKPKDDKAITVPVEPVSASPVVPNDKTERNPTKPEIPDMSATEEDDKAFLDTVGYIDFNNMITKMANENADMSEIIAETLKFAEYIDTEDPSTSLKLLAIVEGEVDSNG